MTVKECMFWNEAQESPGMRPGQRVSSSDSCQAPHVFHTVPHAVPHVFRTSKDFKHKMRLMLISPTKPMLMSMLRFTDSPNAACFTASRLHRLPLLAELPQGGAAGAQLQVVAVATKHPFDLGPVSDDPLQSEKTSEFGFGSNCTDFDPGHVRICKVGNRNCGLH